MPPAFLHFSLRILSSASSHIAYFYLFPYNPYTSLSISCDTVCDTWRLISHCASLTFSLSSWLTPVSTFCCLRRRRLGEHTVLTQVGWGFSRDHNYILINRWIDSVTALLCSIIYQYFLMPCSMLHNFSQTFIFTSVHRGDRGVKENYSTWYHSRPPVSAMWHNTRGRQDRTCHIVTVDAVRWFDPV